MVNVILEIARKEVTSYYARKGIIMQNALLAIIFCFVPLQQIQSALVAAGYRASAFSGALEFFLLFASLYPVVIASGISVFAFPVERDQKTIEHLLSLPLTNGQIFLGKALAAVATALVWAAIMFAVIVGYTLYANAGSIVWDAPLLTPSLAVMIFAIVPSVILLSTLMTVALTSYISNTRGAYMINIVVMGVMIGMTSARSEMEIDPTLFNMILLSALVLFLAVTYVVSVKSFNREKLIAKT